MVVSGDGIHRGDLEGTVTISVGRWKIIIEGNTPKRRRIVIRVRAAVDEMASQLVGFVPITDARGNQGNRAAWKTNVYGITAGIGGVTDRIRDDKS